jgi:hypothetical protein
MDFLDPKKKRAHTIRLYIGYALMAFVLLIVSAILFFEARGFDYDRKTGEVVQNGLVFVNSHPEQATVYVNGREEAKTDARLALPAGDYNFEFRRTGYRTWKRTFSLIGSEIERLNYVFLFPETLSPSDVRPYATAPGFATQSLDRKWLIVQPSSGKLTSFDVVDLGEQNNPATAITLPGNLMNTTAGSDTFELVEWSNDNRHVLVKHSFKGGSEFVMIDREQPSQSLNLNRRFNTTIYKAALRDKKFDKLHILDKNGGTLYFGDSKSRQRSAVATKVHAFKSYSDDVVFYVTGEGAPAGMVDVGILKGKTHHKLRSLTAGTHYPLDITRYDDEWYMAAGSDTDKKAYLYHEIFKDLERSKPITPEPIAVFRLNQLDHIAVSANTRFISVQGGSEFAVYDAEHDRRYQYDTKLALAKGQKAEWMDGHRLTAVSGGKLYAWDYDGINMQGLVNAYPGFIPFFDRDYDFLYTLAPSAKTAGQSALTKTPVRTPEDL